MESDGQPCEGRCTKNSQCAREEFYAVKSVEVQRLDGLVDFMRRWKYPRLATILCPKVWTIRRRVVLNTTIYDKQSCAAVKDVRMCLCIRDC
jgi:hypothetical protein